MKIFISILVVLVLIYAVMQFLTPSQNKKLTEQFLKHGFRIFLIVLVVAACFVFATMNASVQIF